MSDYTPKPENKFTFGLWTVGNIGRDPFGGPVREGKSPAELVRLLGEVGAYGVNFHDNDLIPIAAMPAERDAILKDFKKALPPSSGRGSFPTSGSSCGGPPDRAFHSRKGRAKPVHFSWVIGMQGGKVANMFIHSCG